MKVSPRRGEAAIAGGLALLASYMLYEAWRMPAGSGGQPGPGFVPSAIAVALLAAAVALMARALFGTVEGEAVQIGHGRIWATLCALVAVAFALEPVGYLLTSAGLLAVLMRSYGRTSWKVTLFGACIGACLSWLFFHTLLGVALPAGVLALP